MSLPEPNSTFSSRLSALAKRLGLLGRAPRQILERASVLKLPFSAIPQRKASICWESGIPLHNLVDLPRSALSGPVQEDKAHARSMLLKIIEVEHQSLNAFDLRLVDGLAQCPPAYSSLNSFEQLAASEYCRQIRIISYKDFVKTVSLALPRFLGGEPVRLLQANWHAERVFWAGDHHQNAFASAIAYARLRELEVTIPAHMSTYRLNRQGLSELNQHYHVLAMPACAWSDADFMALLLEAPYSRLTFNSLSGATELLLLSKQSGEATALGEGLLIAGAPDVAAHLQQFV